MKNILIPDDLLKKFPPLYSNEHKRPEDIQVIAKFFTPDSSWTWYATEYDGSNTFFGLVCGCENEFGYFNLSELRQVKGPLGLPIERDKYFQEVTLYDVLKGLRR